MDKRYQVFVSSTYEDLQEERQEVMQALLELDCMPAGMELFPAANEDQWTLIKKVIDECDYYIVILAGRYGSVGPDGESYTEMEYKYALSKNKPIITFLHKDLGSITQDKSETEPQKRKKLEQFRELAKQKMCRFWTTSEELGSVVSRSMIKLMKSNPAVGWVRTNESDPEMSKENLSLRKHIEDLETELKSIGSDAPKGVETLAQGNDEYVLEFRAALRRQKGDYSWQFESQAQKYIVKTTWNEIIKNVLPQCVAECSEWKIVESIQNQFTEIPSFTRGLLDDGWQIQENKLDEKCLREIVIQLKSLGLILPSIKKRSLTDSSKYWTLTKYGENLMDVLCAIHKKIEHGPA